MNDEEVFDFADVDVVLRPMLTTPLPGHGATLRSSTAAASPHPLPGTLFGNSPRPVASGVTRGEKKEESGVRLVHVSDPADICGGVIGIMENKKFCAAHPSLCDHPLIHGKRKFELQPDTLYVMSPKKGAMHTTLEPKLAGMCVPSDKALVDLLNDERPVAMWHVYFDGCNTTETLTGYNELETPKDVSWEAIDRPSLEDLERANDFKTPRKVCLMPGVWDNKDTFELIKPEQLDTLDLTGLFPIKGSPSPNQKAFLQMIDGWDRIKGNFELLWTTVKT
jgi:hypothetical protein